MLLDYPIMPVYALVMLDLGRYGMHKTKNQSDFLAVGRHLGSGLCPGTIAAMVLGGASTVGTVKLGYQSGLSGLQLVLMLGLGIIVPSLVFSRRIACLWAFTVTQVLEQRYRTFLRLISGMIMAVYDLMMAVTTATAVGSVIEVVFDIPRIPTILCDGGIVIAYLMISGVWSLTLTDIVQFIIKTTGIFLVLLSLSIDGADGPTRMQEVLPVGFFDLGHISLDTILTYFLLYFSGAPIGQDIWQRVFTARSEMVVCYTEPGAGVYCMLYSAACALTDAVTRVLLPDLAMPENAYVEIVREMLVPGLCDLMVAAALSAIMPTASGCLLAATTVLQEDIYAHFLRPGTTSDIHLSRCIILLMGVAMLVLACLVNDVIAAPSIAYNLLVGGLLVPIIGTLLWRRASPQGAIASIVADCLAATVCMAHGDLFASPPIVYGLLISLTTFAAVSLAIRPAANPRAQPE